MSGKYIKGITDLATVCPELVKEWHKTKNGDLLPEDITAHTNRKVWWKCSKCGYEWEANVNNRSKGHGCPECARKLISEKNRKRSVQIGINDLKSQFPEIAKEWDYDKNSLLPEEVSINSAQKFWWKCKNGHEWQTQVSVRTRGNNCPYCAGLRILTGYNDLATLRPDLLKEWDYEKNEIVPERIGTGSEKKVWWKCNNGHSYLSSIGARNSGTGCPFCSGRYAIVGLNDLETLYPDLTKEWNYEKNGDLLPKDVKPKSNRKVWWKCEYGHEWQSTVVNRVTGRGCPICSNSGTSMVEQGVAFYLSMIYSIQQRKIINDCEIDIYLPDYKIGIEYDGIYFHSTTNAKQRETKKNKVLKDNGIKLIRIKETKNREETKNNIIYYIPDGMRNNYTDMIKRLISMLSLITKNNHEVSINLERDILTIREYYSTRRIKNSLANLQPEIAEEWNYEKNGNLTPEMFSHGSAQKVWWKCKYGHEWIADINTRVNNRSGCPYCSGKFVLKGVNDLSTLFPELLKEWDYDNNDISPDSVSIGSSRCVSWICPNGHHYNAIINHRTKKGSGCPYCSNKKVLSGYNDLLSNYPDLMNEWDYDKNNILPQNILGGSHIKVWWKCSKGHSYKAPVENRTKQGQGCPYCANKKIIIGFNDLLTNCPEVAEEWNYEKNFDLKPTDVTVSSNKKVWWKCKYGHEWQTGICHRTNPSEKTSCPYCAGQKTIIGENDLFTVNPKLASEWNYEKNKDLTPQMVMPKSGKRVWWKCPQCGYEWESTIANRTIRKSGCPNCKHKWIND